MNLSDHADPLDTELIGWLTTVSPESQPQSSAVWFLREGDELIVYSRPNATRLINLAGNERIAFNLRGDQQGDVIVTMEGRARVVDGPAAHEIPAYLEKYGDEIIRLGWSHPEFGHLYSTRLSLEIDRVRAWG
jgi:PPOX class probable F420-dependent enzyme